MSNPQPTDPRDFIKVFNDYDVQVEDYHYTEFFGALIAIADTYAAAKVREALEKLLKQQVGIWDEEDQCEYIVVPVGDIKEAIAAHKDEGETTA